MRHNLSWKAATKCFAVGLLVLGLTVGFAPVVGADIPINDVDGTWTNAVPPVTIDNSTDPRTARWGTTTGQQSEYDWSPVSTPFDALSNGTPFSLGTFNHRNFPISGTILSSIDLNFTMTIDALTPITGFFHFNHNETPNATPCDPLGTTVCPDVVTITSPLLNTPFTYDSNNYYFSLLGFSQDGGSTIVMKFVTEENQQNIADLYGVITERPIGGEVPEPTTILLLGSGLIGLAGYGRKKFFKK